MAAGGAGRAGRVQTFQAQAAKLRAAPLVPRASLRVSDAPETHRSREGRFEPKGGDVPSTVSAVAVGAHRRGAGPRLSEGRFMWVG